MLTKICEQNSFFSFNLSWILIFLSKSRLTIPPAISLGYGMVRRATKHKPLIRDSSEMESSCRNLKKKSFCINIHLQEAFCRNNKKQTSLIKQLVGILLFKIRIIKDWEFSTNCKGLGIKASNHPKSQWDLKRSVKPDNKRRGPRKRHCFSQHCFKYTALISLSLK